MKFSKPAPPDHAWGQVVAAIERRGLILRNRQLDGLCHSVSAYLISWRISAKFDAYDVRDSYAVIVYRNHAKVLECLALIEAYTGRELEVSFE